MRYFTPDLLVKLNASNSEAVDQAMEEWEKAITAYNSRLKKVRVEMPPESRRVSELSLHDWGVVAFGHLSQRTAAILLEQNKRIVILTYSLNQKLKRVDYRRTWPLSKERVHWLYDELDCTEGDQKSFIHRILFSDGTTLLVPFTSCRALEAESGHTMSHDDMLQIA